MPGIFGFAHDPARRDGLRIEQLARRMKHHAWYQEHLHADAEEGFALGRVALGFIDPAPQPVFSGDGTIAAVLDGEIYDADEQRQRLMSLGHDFRGSSQAEVLLHGYQTGGLRWLAGLHGKFVGAVWDGRAKQLILVTDRFGMRPLYYAHAAGRLLFASEIKALLSDPGVSRKLHVPSVAQFFSFGQLLGDGTFYEGIRLMPAAGCLVYDVAKDKVSIDRYWKLEDVPASTSGTEAQALDRIADAFDRAVARASAGANPLGLSLSGGLDARSILGAMPLDRVQVKTVCLGMEGSMDLASSRQLAKLVGQPYHQVVLDTKFLSRFGEHLEHMVRLTDGHYLSQCIVMPTLPLYRELGIQVLLRGHAGELLHMTKAYNFSLDGEALAARDDDAIERWLMQHLQTYMLDGTSGKLFTPAYQSQMAELARESLREMIRPYRGTVPPAQQVGRLFLAMRTRRETAMSLVKFGSLVETRLPYLDNELVEAVLSAPMELRLDEKIQAHILRRRRPEFLGVRNVNTGARMGAGALERLCAKVRQKVFAKLGVKGYQPYERLGLWLRREIAPLVDDILLSPRCLGRGIFEPQAVRDVIARHKTGQANHTFLLMAMMVFEVGHCTFADGDAAAEPAARTREPACPA
jgi:asparagine synthase (glutamine-hydrolysing)